MNPNLPQRQRQRHSSEKQGNIPKSALNIDSRARDSLQSSRIEIPSQLHQTIVVSRPERVDLVSDFSKHLGETRELVRIHVRDGCRSDAEAFGKFESLPPRQSESFGIGCLFQNDEDACLARSGRWVAPDDALCIGIECQDAVEVLLVVHAYRLGGLVLLSHGGQKSRHGRTHRAVADGSPFSASENAIALEDELLVSDFNGCGKMAFAQMMIQERRSLPVQSLHLDGSYSTSVGLEMDGEQQNQCRPCGNRRLDPGDDPAAEQHACQGDDSFLTRILRIELTQIALLGKMCTQTGLCAPRCDSAQGTKNTAETQNHHTRRLGENGRQTVEDEAGIIENVCQQAVHFALGLQGHAKAVREHDGGNATDGVLEDGQQERSGCIGSRISDAHAFEDRTRREHGSNTAGKGLQGVLENRREKSACEAIGDRDRDGWIDAHIEGLT